MSRPLAYLWNAEAGTMTVLPRFAEAARRLFKPGETVILERRLQRSTGSHAHFMACVNEAWQNLDDETREILATPTLLRGWALVQAGWHNQTVQHIGDRQASLRSAMALRRAHDLASTEGYAEFTVRQIDDEWYVVSRIPRSIRLAAMDKEEFERCKADVLAVLSGAIHVSRRSLERAGKAAEGV